MFTGFVCGSVYVSASGCVSYALSWALFLFVIVLVCIVLFLCCCLFCNEKERKGIDVWEWEDGRIWDDLREGTMIRIYYIKKYTI